eukprot:maker-scaffold64_size435223-snap-gene-2.20 protein:Tk02496 transcript:maker-scaffold64_size435223-snap-gene-2.20-mRNA-1 annotation:"short-chain dehydrogenase"
MKVALITGASSGIGAAIAIELAKEGNYSLALAARRRDKLDEVAQLCQAGGAKEVKILVKDLKNLTDCETAVSETIDHFGRLDVVISNAGIGSFSSPITEKPFEKAREVMLLNYMAPFVLTQKALPHLEKAKGSILYVGSLLGTMPAPGLADYCASKAALHAMAKSVAQEYLTKGVRVNILAPGAVATDLLGEFLANGEANTRDHLASALVPMGRVGTCEEMGHLAAFLVSDKNSFMTGTVIVADGGQTIDLKLGEYNIRVEKSKLASHQ